MQMVTALIDPSDRGHDRFIQQPNILHGEPVDFFNQPSMFMKPVLYKACEDVLAGTDEFALRSVDALFASWEVARNTAVAPAPAAAPAADEGVRLNEIRRMGARDAATRDYRVQQRKFAVLVARRVRITFGQRLFNSRNGRPRTEFQHWVMIESVLKEQGQSTMN